MTNIRRDSGLVKDADLHLWVRWLGSELEIGVTQALTHGVHADQGTRAQEVLALQ